MINVKKLIIALTLCSCFLILISAVSAADFYVNENTTQKDIENWLKNATKGDNLTFNVTNYTLNDTLNISQSITIRSDNNTLIFFSKNKDMFNVKTDGITFSGLTLVFKGQGTSKMTYGAISTLNASNSTTKQLIVENTIIYVNNKYTSGILLGTLQGNIINSTINVKGVNCVGISLTKWIGNLTNSKITSTGKDSICVYSQTWRGIINGTNISNDGDMKKVYTTGFLSINSKGSIVKSTIKSKNYHAVMVSDNVNISKSSISSKKGLAKAYRYRPDLVIYNQINVSKNTYFIKIYNIGQIKSKACTFQFKVSTITKTATVKALKVNGFTTVKIKLPAKYFGNRYTKIIKVDSTKVNKENNKKNNIGKFKF